MWNMCNMLVLVVVEIIGGRLYVKCGLVRVVVLDKE